MSVKIPLAPSSPVMDPRLPARARGIWVTLASISGPDMEVPSALERLKEELPDGPHAIRSGLSVLEECGYIRKVTRRDERGKIAGTTWQLNPRPARETGSDLGAVA